MKALEKVGRHSIVKVTPFVDFCRQPFSSAVYPVAQRRAGSPLLQRILNPVFLFVFSLAGFLLLSSCREVPLHATGEVVQDADTTSIVRDILPEAPADTFRTDRFWNDLARMLGGMNPLAGSVLDSVDYAADAHAHQQFFAQAWHLKKHSLLDSLDWWAAQEFREEHYGTRPVFYPFSGADFVTIHTLYPNALSYTMFGLEPEGSIVPPQKLDPQRRYANLVNVQHSMDDIINFSFFKTNDMRGDFTRYEWKGTLPLLLAFCARRQNEIINAYRIQVLEDGTVAPATDSLPQFTDDPIVTGWRIRFRPIDNPKAPVQTLDYFSVNVHDPYLTQLRGFRNYFGARAPMRTYIKSASYLLHKPYFGKMAVLIAEVSENILQDDSGYPLRSFDRSYWDLQFYGAYEHPIPLFANLYQTDLRQVYLTDSTVKRLPFGIGYVFTKGRSNLMLARKRVTTP